MNTLQEELADFGPNEGGLLRIYITYASALVLFGECVELDIGKFVDIAGADREVTFSKELGIRLIPTGEVNRADGMKLFALQSSDAGSLIEWFNQFGIDPVRVHSIYQTVVEPGTVIVPNLLESADDGYGYQVYFELQAGTWVTEVYAPTLDMLLDLSIKAQARSLLHV